MIDHIQINTMNLSVKELAKGHTAYRSLLDASLPDSVSNAAYESYRFYEDALEAAIPETAEEFLIQCAALMDETDYLGTSGHKAVNEKAVNENAVNLIQKQEVSA